MTITRSKLTGCLLTGAILAGLPGCRTRIPNGDGNSAQLSPEVQKAVDDVVVQFTPAAEAFAAFSSPGGSFPVSSSATLSGSSSLSDPTVQSSSPGVSSW